VNVLLEVSLENLLKERLIEVSCAETSFLASLHVDYLEDNTDFYC